MKKILRYSLTDRLSQLLYTEANSIKLPCLMSEEIPKILSYMHDICEHYSDLITLNQLINEAYWLTQTHDVKAWCHSCLTC